MKDLAMKELQEYIQTAIIVETDVATQELIKKEFDDCKYSSRPTFVEPYTPVKPQAPQSDYGFSLSSNSNMLLASLSGLAGFLFLGVTLIGLAMNDPNNTVLIIVSAIISICCLIPFFSKRSSSKAEYEKAEMEYQRQLKDYKERVERSKLYMESQIENHKKNVAKWEEFRNALENKINQAYDRSISIRKEVYAQDVIYSKYRNLPALTSIYEYLITGRCEGLTGPHGAYNLYEDELRKDMIISQLSIVIDNLEQIRKNQYMLYQQVKEIQQTTSSIEKELRLIEGHTASIASLTALNTYYAALTERNTRISMWCNL